jgi:hypothetical protein
VRPAAAKSFTSFARTRAAGAGMEEGDRRRGGSGGGGTAPPESPDAGAVSIIKRRLKSK